MSRCPAASHAPRTERGLPEPSPVPARRTAGRPPRREIVAARLATPGRMQSLVGHPSNAPPPAVVARIARPGPVARVIGERAFAPHGIEDAAFPARGWALASVPASGSDWASGQSRASPIPTCQQPFPGPQALAEPLVVAVVAEHRLS